MNTLVILLVLGVVGVMGLVIAAARARPALDEIQGSLSQAQAQNRLAACSRITASERISESGAANQWLPYVDRKE